MQEKQRRAWIMVLITVALGLLAAGLVLVFRQGFRIPCVFYELTGLQCPGCGNTRAVLAVLRLDLKAAFAYNPLFLPEVAYIAYVYLYCCVRYVKTGQFRYREKIRVGDVCFLVVVALWGILRNFLGP